MEGGLGRWDVVGAFICVKWLLWILVFMLSRISMTYDSYARIVSGSRDNVDAYVSRMRVGGSVKRGWGSAYWVSKIKVFRKRRVSARRCCVFANAALKGYVG